MTNPKSEIRNPNDVLKTILKKPNLQAEVFLLKSTSNRIKVLDQKVETVDEINDAGIAIRVIKDKKLGFAYTSDLDSISETIDQAIANAANSEPDQFLTFAEKKPVPTLNLFDDQIPETSIKDKIKLALEIEKCAYAHNDLIKKTQDISYSDSEAELWLANSNGVDLKYKANSCGAMADVIASFKGQNEIGFGMDFRTKYSSLDPKVIGIEAAEKAVELLGAKTIPSQKMDLVLSPFIATQLLELLAGMLSSDAVQKGKSLFADKLEKSVGSNLLNIIDDGLLKDGLGSAPFDAEGTPCQRTPLIENGVLKNFFYDIYTANKGKKKSTGNATRGSFKTPPMISPTNLFIEAGEKNEKEIIGSIKKGLYVVRLMGLHTANPISGDFSFGASGIMIENGKKTFPVREITIAGNLIKILEQIEAIGSNLRFFGNVGAPSLLISNISVGGH